MNWRLWAVIVTGCAMTMVACQRAKIPREVVIAELPGGEEHIRVYLTAYSFWDNTPRRSAKIAHPVLHKKAGGTGTYADPITLAVGHRIEDEVSLPDYLPGTLFYLPRLKKYAIVEDVCGDGDTPQNGPCHIGYRGHPWLDLYIGGASHDADVSLTCGKQITGLQAVVMHPKSSYPTKKGEVLTSTCGQEPAASINRPR